MLFRPYLVVAMMPFSTISDRVGRDPEHMLPDEYIWQPVAEESYHNLKYTQDRNLPSNRPVNRHGIAASIRKDLRDAGVLNWKR